MKKEKIFTESTKIRLKPLEEICELCSTKLEYKTLVVDKHISTLDGVLHIVSRSKCCSKEDCLNFINKVSYVSNETHKYALPKSTFGLDVVAYIGFKRTQENKNFDEIHKELVKKNILISRRNVDNLYKSFEYLIKCSLSSRLKELAPIFKKNGGVILSIDGLEPQHGNDLLYVIRDVETQEVLHGEILHYTDTNAMVKLFKEIKACGIHVKGIISDGQKSIRKARDLVFPDVPYQLCTFHYLKDMGKPVGEKDSKIRVALKKNCVD